MNSKDPRVKTLNPKIGGPLALILVVAFAGIFIYGWVRETRNNKAYIANPKIRDIYYTRNDLNRYSIMELVDIKGDELLVQKGDFTVGDKKELKTREWTFLPAVWIRITELQRMYDAGQIYTIARPDDD